MPDPKSFVCPSRRKTHEGLPMDVAFLAPFYWDSEKAKIEPEKWHLDSDTCVIRDAESCFVRDVLEFPIESSKDVFVWGI